MFFRNHERRVRDENRRAHLAVAFAENIEEDLDFGRRAVLRADLVDDQQIEPGIALDDLELAFAPRGTPAFMHLCEKAREGNELTREARFHRNLRDRAREMRLPIAEAAREDEAVAVLDARSDVLAEVDDECFDTLLLFRFRLEAVDGAADVALRDSHAREALQMLTLLHAKRTLSGDHLRLEKAFLRRVNDLHGEASVLLALAPAHDDAAIRQAV